MNITNTLSKSQWNLFLAKHPSSNIFHTPEMFGVFHRAENYQPKLWAVVENDEVLALLITVHITLISNIVRALTTRAVSYGSIFCHPSPRGEQALEKLLEAYTAQIEPSVLFTELRNLSDVGKWQSILQKHQFQYGDHLNYLVDLNRPVAEIMQAIGKRTRKQIRRSIRNSDVTIKEAGNLEEVWQCYELLKLTYNAAGIPLADWTLFKTTFEILYPKGMVKFLLVQVSGQDAAASVELLFKDQIYGWYGGTNRDFSNYYPTERLLWYIFEWGAKNGYRVYDFGGAGKPNKKYGVRDFKAKFGGDLVCYGRNTCIHAPIRLRISKLGYFIYRLATQKK